MTNTSVYAIDLTQSRGGENRRISAYSTNRKTTRHAASKELKNRESVRIFRNGKVLPNLSVVGVGPSFLNAWLMLLARRFSMAMRFMFASYEIVGSSSGSHVLITGGVHGDELEPMAATRQLGTEIRPAELCGRVTFVLIVHARAFALGQRPGDDRLDRARTWPGRGDGSVSQQLAFALRFVSLGADQLSVKRGLQEIDGKFAPLGVTRVVMALSQPVDCGFRQNFCQMTLAFTLAKGV